MKLFIEVNCALVPSEGVHGIQKICAVKLILNFFKTLYLAYCSFTFCFWMVL